MGLQSWMVLLVIIIIFVLVMITETVLENNSRYYNCYVERRYRGKADGFKCKGVSDGSKCPKCPYYKKYWRDKDGSSKESL